MPGVLRRICRVCPPQSAENGESVDLDMKLTTDRNNTVTEPPLHGGGTITGPYGVEEAFQP